MTLWLNRNWYSGVAEPEDWTGTEGGYIDSVDDGGAVTGTKTLGDFFLVFQENLYTVYQYTVGDNPFANPIKTWNHGCNHGRTIVEIDGFVYYLSGNGDIRKTNGLQDVVLSERIKPLTVGILNSRNIKDYYSGTAPETVPTAFRDKVNNAYRLFYSGTSTNNDKCLSYFLDRDVFTTAPSTNVLTAVSVYGYEDYVAALGNSDADGKTYYMNHSYSATDTTGTLDLGWISSGNPQNKIKIYGIELWLHAQAGSAAPDNCSLTMTATVYDDPSSSTSTSSNTNTLAYNSIADNLQKVVIPINVVGDYIRIVLTDSGSKTNYSIDKIIVKHDIMQTQG